MVPRSAGPGFTDVSVVRRVLSRAWIPTLYSHSVNGWGNRALDNEVTVLNSAATVGLLRRQEAKRAEAESRRADSFPDFSRLRPAPVGSSTFLQRFIQGSIFSLGFLPPRELATWPTSCVSLTTACCQRLHSLVLSKLAS